MKKLLKFITAKEYSLFELAGAFAVAYLVSSGLYAAMAFGSIMMVNYLVKEWSGESD